MNSVANPTPAAEPAVKPQTSLYDEVYPPELRKAEAEQIAGRRKQNEIDPPDAPRVGMALSGGGIRSATFCLGVFQALAREKLIGKIDLLSTVSGGGYFGSFLGGLFQREQPLGVKTVEAKLADSNSWPVRWLRENGRYMSPNGAGDVWLAAAVMLRNWVAVHVVLLTFVLMLLVSASLFRAWIWQSFAPHAGAAGVPGYEVYFAQHWLLGIWWSPFIILPAATFLGWMAPCGSLYWLTQSDLIMKCVTAVARRPAKGAGRLSEAEVVGHLREGLSRGLAAGLIFTVGLLAFALIDSLGQTLYARWFIGESSFPSFSAGIAAAGLAILGMAQKIFAFLEKLPKRRAFRLPFNVMALLGALFWVLLILVGLSFVTHGMAWGWEFESSALAVGSHELLRMVGWPLLLCTLGTTFLLSVWFSHDFGFVNLSSQQQLYAARLKRAYFGASNPQRRETQKFSITNPIQGDEITFQDYHPHRHGGPLHLINITVNETISGKSQIEQRDRKGLPLAIGPSGLSVGAKDHALWGPTRNEITPILHADEGRFHALHSVKSANIGKPHEVEQLALGNWMAISGAAFTTGLGAGTSLGMSLLLGLANVRLGYWWDSHLPQYHRAHRTRPNRAGGLGGFCGLILPVQSCLLNEFLARFHGPARRHWYLSDGGHFENTACYELIRRRVPFIICTDAGRDTRYEFEDAANLVRKARTDFKAEIEFIRRRADSGQNRHGGAYPLPALEELVHPQLLDIIGQPEDFWPVPGAVTDEVKGAASGRPQYATRHALLARVHYLDPHEFGYILFLKPSLTGDEPTDILQYQKAQPDFPQESTMDQYFDEAQWESYRKLGELIGSVVFAPPTGHTAEGKPSWSPRELRAPQVKPPPKPSVVGQPEIDRQGGGRTVSKMADYIDKNILCEANVHVNLPGELAQEQLDSIKLHLTQFANSRAKFFVYPEVDVEVEFRSGSLKTCIKIAGSLYAAMVAYGEFRTGVDFLYTDVKRLADTIVAECLFITKARHTSILRTEARTGVVGPLKILLDEMNTVECSLGQISVGEISRRIKKIKDDADVLLASVRAGQDRENIEGELERFADSLPEKCPHDPDQRPPDSAVTIYYDVLSEFRKSYSKKRKKPER